MQMGLQYNLLISSSTLAMSRPLFFLSVVLCLFSLCDLSQDAEWSYTGEHGANHWHSMFPDKCGGRKQSPINIVTKDTRFQSFQPFVFKNYRTVPSAMKITNNGHTVAITFTFDSPEPVIYGGGLPTNFELAQYHFHWGANSSVGSEHTLNGRSYPLEMHVIHRNKHYGDLSEALGHSDGVAVMGYFFKVTKDGNTAKGFEKLIASLGSVTSEGSTVELKAANVFSIDTLIPDYPTYNFNRFFRYNGSLTTPKCNEAVIWTVLRDPLPISEQQLEVFRKVLGHHGEPMSGNYRPTLPLNGRIVQASNKEDAGNGVSSVYSPIPIVTIILMAAPGFSFGY